MKSKSITVNKIWNRMNDVLDAYHYYNRKEVAENKKCFECAIQYKDKAYINEICSNFDDTDAYEAGIIKDIHTIAGC